jgi:CheY-like chemotaxis protein
MGGNGRCVLVVEDDEVVRNVIAALLEDEGYRVVTAPNGEAALQHLAQPDAPKPEAILLDMWMPVMDGHEFIAVYRQRPGRHAPIIAMTGALFGSDTQPMPAVDEFLAKPFDVDALLRLLRKHTHTQSAPHPVPA